MSERKQGKDSPSGKGSSPTTRLLVLVMKRARLDRVTAGILCRVDSGLHLMKDILEQIAFQYS